MLHNAYFLPKIGADTAENEQYLAEILPIGRRVADHGPAGHDAAAELENRRNAENSYIEGTAPSRSSFSQLVLGARSRRSFSELQKAHTAHTDHTAHTAVRAEVAGALMAAVDDFSFSISAA